MRCKNCGHEFQSDKQHMVYCPCGKTFSDWVWGDIYRYGGEFEELTHDRAISR